MSFEIDFNKISDNFDKTIFEESFNVYELGFYRSAYILFWLCCVESLKRKFREAGKIESKANDIYAQIIQLEKQHKAVDLSIIERAENYGFINDIEKCKLNQIYELRCIYAHPYEKSPSQIDVEKIIQDITEIVLFRPPTLCNNFIEQLVSKLTTDINYLEDYEEKVKEQTKKWLIKINSNCHVYFVECLWQFAEENSLDISAIVYFRRAIWIIQTILEKINFDFWEPDKWLSFVSDFPISSINILVNKDFFYNIDPSVQRYLINKTLELTNTSPNFISFLIVLLEDKDKLGEQYQKIINYIDKIEISKTSNLPLKYISNQLIEAFYSGTFTLQKVATLSLMQKIKELGYLTKEQQFNIGKSFNYAAHYVEWTAEWHFKDIIKDKNINNYPKNFLIGIFDYLFFDLSDILMFKNNLITDMTIFVDNLNEETKEEFIEIIKNKLSSTKNNYNFDLYRKLFNENIQINIPNSLNEIFKQIDELNLPGISNK